MLHNAQHGVVYLVDQLVEFLTHIRRYRLLSAIGEKLSFCLLQTTVVPQFHGLPLAVLIVEDLARPLVVSQSLGIQQRLNLMAMNKALDSTRWFAL